MGPASAVRSSGSWVQRSIVAVIASVGIMASVTAPASAAEMSAYLTRTTYLGGYCPGTWNQVVQSGLTASPDKWRSSWKLVRVDKGGNFETLVYRQTGVSRFNKSLACTNSSQYRRIATPTRYVHRYLYKNYLCYGGSCQHMYTDTSGWASRR